MLTTARGLPLPSEAAGPHVPWSTTVALVARAFLVTMRVGGPLIALKSSRREQIPL